MFERFTDNARRSVVIGQEHARRLSAPGIDLGLVLAGIIDVDERAERVLRLLGVDAASWRAELLATERPTVESSPKALPMTLAAKKALEHSLREALQNGNNYIDAPHLLLGILRCVESQQADDIVLPAGLTRDKALKVILELDLVPPLPVVPSSPSTDVLPPLAPSGTTPTVTPGYVSDAVKAIDCLAFQPDVEMLASVMVARDAHPPLSIGLFAPWGSGKSFFLGLLHERVASLARASNAAAAGGRESYYCADVRQITFNAWHYADANLWASLASHIFEELAREPTEQTVEGRRTSIVEQLASAKALVDELEQAKEARDRAHSRLAGLGRVFDTQAPRSALGRAVDKELADGLDRVEELAGSLLPNDPAVDDVRELAADLRRTGSSLRTTWHWLRGVRRIVLRVGTLIVLALLAVAARSLLMSETVDAAVASIGAILLAAAQYALVLREPLRKVRDATKSLAVVARRLDEEREAERARAEADLDHARHRVTTLTTELDDLRSGRQFARLVAERHASGAYARHLGLVSEIRRDFEEMASLLQRSSDEGGPRVERVVLYIDDLDRCPSSRVAEVLEAVHLLLAVPLFVVVVAVDPRWLLKSLATQHAHSLSGGVGGATPTAYLEKIFQVVYSLPAMETRGYETLISTLMSQSTESEPRAEVSSAPPERRAAPRPSQEASPAHAERVVSEGPHDVTPAALRVSAAETKFMRSLGSLVGTPRAAKRLVNVYRLLRAGVPEAHIESYVSSGEYAAVLVLGAILVGSPADAESIFRILLDRRSETKDAANALRTEFDSAIARAAADALDGAARAGRAAASLTTYHHWIPRVRRLSLVPLS